MLFFFEERKNSNAAAWTTSVLLKCSGGVCCRPTCVFVCVCVASSCRVRLYMGRRLGLKHSVGFFASGKLRHRCARLHRKGDSNPSRHYLPLIRALNGWINKSLFRIVFGEGIVPAVLPLGPWLELRESTLCNTPGGYEEQMSCLLPSSSRLKAAHTHTYSHVTEDD